MFRRKLMAFMLFVVWLTLAPTLVSASSSPIRYYLTWVSSPVFYGLQNTQPTDPVETAATSTITWTGTSDWSYVTDTTELTLFHLNLRGSLGYPGMYMFNWTLKDETTGVDISSLSWGVILGDAWVALGGGSLTASASVAKTDTISFTLTCTSYPTGASYFEIGWSGATKPYDSWIDVPEAEVGPSVPEFSLTMPVVTAIAAVIYLAIRKRIGKKLE